MELLNTNPHRVEGDGTPATRLGSGQSRNFEGETADHMLSIPGVVEADSDEAREYLETHQQPGTDSDHPGARHLRLSKLSDARVAGRLAASASLRTVIGDDEAPYGPPSGTITTKSAVARQDPVARQAFADNEALPEDAGLRNAPQRSAQGENAGRAEELATEVLSETTPGFTSDPEPRGEAERDDVDVPKGDGPEPGSDGPDTPPGYDDVTVAELDERLRDRGLPVDGNKREKYDRLYNEG